MKKGIRFLLLALMSLLLVFTMTACLDDVEDEDYDYDEERTVATEQTDDNATAGQTGQTVETVETAYADFTGEAPSAEGWTLFIYMCGSDLESDGGCATGDIQEILDSTYNENVRVVIQTGGALTWQNDVVDASAIERYARTEDQLAFVESQPAANMGDASTLESFLQWGITNYASEHMALVFWNHGGGSISGVCFDERNKYDSLSLQEINTAINSVTSLLSAPLEVVGFDACLMSTLETANMLSPYARYLYASEETEPGAGWNYTDILNFLAENPNADGKALGELQYQSYYDYCMQDGDDPTVTFSITDLSAIATLSAALDQVSDELLSAEDSTGVIRAIIGSDNFGGNNRSEGYTNMVDLADMLRNVSAYAPSADQALQALDNAVIYCKNASQHKNAGGLSIYYPLSVQGSTEISTFRDICPSTNYYAFVAKIAGGADLSVTSSSTNGAGAAGISESSSLSVSEAYLDDNGIYTVVLGSMDEFAYASCSLYLAEEDGTMTYLGEDDNVVIDYDNCMIQDNFDGSWLCLEEYLLPIELVSQNETISLYSCEVLCNGESTYLQIIYDWDSGEYSILGTWDGVNSETGMAARSADPLQDGDVLNIVYWYTDENDNWDYYTSEDITVKGTPELYYAVLPSTDYYYAINVYDIYGNVYELDFTVFYVDEDGSVLFYED